MDRMKDPQGAAGSIAGRSQHAISSDRTSSMR